MSEVKNIIQIEGVFLTPEAIQDLRNLQDENNVIHSLIIENIGILALYIADLDPDKDHYGEQLEMIKKLSFIKAYIQHLKKP